MLKDIDNKTKRQIKSSIKRICTNIIKLNIDNLAKIKSCTVYSVWTNRYICVQGKRKFYNLIEVDDALESELLHNMDVIFNRELSKLPKENLEEYSKAIKNSENQNHRFKEATPKQIYYASYLMNMVKNKPLPKRKYTMAEIGTLISILKKQLKV